MLTSLFLSTLVHTGFFLILFLNEMGPSVGDGGSPCGLWWWQSHLSLHNSLGTASLWPGDPLVSAMRNSRGRGPMSLLPKLVWDCKAVTKQMPDTALAGL